MWSSSYSFHVTAPGSLVWSGARITVCTEFLHMFFVLYISMGFLHVLQLDLYVSVFPPTDAPLMTTDPCIPDCIHNYWIPTRIKHLLKVSGNSALLVIPSNTLMSLEFGLLKIRLFNLLAVNDTIMPLPEMTFTFTILSF